MVDFKYIIKALVEVLFVIIGFCGAKYLLNGNINLTNSDLIWGFGILMLAHIHEIKNQ